MFYNDASPGDTIKLNNGWNNSYFGGRTFSTKDYTPRQVRVGGITNTGTAATGFVGQEALVNEANRQATVNRNLEYARMKTQSIPSGTNPIPMGGPVHSSYQKPYHLPPGGYQPSTHVNNAYTSENIFINKAKHYDLPGGGTMLGEKPIIHPPPPNARFVAGADGVFDRHRPYGDKTYGSIMREEAIAYNYSKSAGKTAYHRPIGPLPATGYKPEPGLNWWGRNAGKVKVGAGILGAAVGATLLVVGAGAYAGGTYLASNMSSHPTNRERYLGSQGAY